MRNQFDKQLDELNVELITMGALCEEAITAAINAMEQETDNEAFRTKVSQTEAAINQKERDIESLCMKLLLRQQPVAKDPAHHFLRAEDDLGYGAHRRPGRRYRGDHPLFKRAA